MISRVALHVVNLVRFAMPLLMIAVKKGDTVNVPLLAKEGLESKRLHSTDSTLLFGTSKETKGIARLHFQQP